MELLPCPFRHDLDMEGRVRVLPSPGGGWNAICFGCTAHGPLCRTEADAASAWNEVARASSPSVAGETRAAVVEECAKVCEDLAATLERDRAMCAAGVQFSIGYTASDVLGLQLARAVELAQRIRSLAAQAARSET